MHWIFSKSEYKVTGNTTTLSNITLTLEYTGKDDFYLKKTSPIIKNLIFVLQVHSFTDFSFKITDTNRTRYEIPQKDPYPVDPLINSTFSINLSGIVF